MPKIEYSFHGLRTTNFREYSKLLLKANPIYKERQLASSRNWHKKHCRETTYKANRNERVKKSIKKKRDLVLWLLGNKCVICDFEDARALQIDHIAGGGNSDPHRRDRRIFLGHVLESIERGENKYQLLCANCNWIKRVEQKECYKRIRNPSLKVEIK